MTSREQLNDITKQIEELQAQRQKLRKDALAGHEAIDETVSEIFTTGCPDSDPPRATIQKASSTGGYCAVIANGGEPLAEYLHLTPNEALAHFEAAAIARIEKQIRTLPDRLGKLKARKPVIKE